jgi:hypothetical protein
MPEYKLTSPVLVLNHAVMLVPGCKVGAVEPTVTIAALRDVRMLAATSGDGGNAPPGSRVMFIG